MFQSGGDDVMFARRSQGGTPRRGGFTLIELLIVVAIIAILAAIAVPNFIDAQTRSKVSRVLNDLRTLRTAAESYAVDNTVYPRMTWGCFYGDTWTLGSVCEEIFGTFSGGPARDCSNVVNPAAIGGGITTPISYISTLMFDPFGAGQNTAIDALLFTYWYIDNFRENRTGMSCPVPGGLAYVPSPGQANLFEFWFGKYVLWSIGPAGQAGLSNPGRDFFTAYDPTNGTTSDGSIFVSHKFFAPQYVDTTQTG